MALWGRLGGNSDNHPDGNIALETFHAVIREWVRGGITAGQGASALNLDGDESTQAQRLKAGFDALASDDLRLEAANMIYDVMRLHEAGLIYTTGAEVEARVEAWFNANGVDPF